MWICLSCNILWKIRHYKGASSSHLSESRRNAILREPIFFCWLTTLKVPSSLFKSWWQPGMCFLSVIGEAPFSSTWGTRINKPFREYSETKHKPQPYISEFSSPPPQFFICILFRSSHPLVFGLLICGIVSCIYFRVAVKEVLGIRSEGLET